MTDADLSIIRDDLAEAIQRLRAIEARLGDGGEAAVDPVDEYAAKVKRSLSVPKYAERVSMSERRIWALISSNPPKVISFKTHGGRRLIDPEDNPVQ